MLSIDGLTHTYANGVTALSDVTLTIPNGMFGLLGPNGAGKSTLMRVLATLQIPTAGAVTYDGVDVLKEPQRLREILGYLPQDFGVYPRVSAEDLLDHLAVLKGFPNSGPRRAAVHALLHQVNLWPHRKKAVSSFSGGMRQRFGIAQALIGAPKLVIVDEPTAGLDPDERNRFLNLLAGISEDVVVILSTHIVEDVTQLCSRMAILAGGKVVREGEPAALIADLKGRIWRGTAPRGGLAEARARHHVISERLLGGATVIHVLADASPGDGFLPVEAGLEDVYFATLPTAPAA